MRIIEFLSSLEFRAHINDSTWDLISNLRVRLGDGRILAAPTGFNTDLASVPRVFWNVLPPFGRYEEAAVIHDWIYRQAGHVQVFCEGQWRDSYITRKEADDILRAGMVASEVPAWQRFAIYWAVRWFGASSFTQRAQS